MRLTIREIVISCAVIFTAGIALVYYSADTLQQYSIMKLDGQQVIEGQVIKITQQNKLQNKSVKDNTITKDSKNAGNTGAYIVIAKQISVPINENGQIVGRVKEGDMVYAVGRYSASGDKFYANDIYLKSK